MDCVTRTIMLHLGRYMLVTTTYGCISAIPQTWRQKRKYTNGETFMTELLPTPIVEKFGRVFLKSLAATAWWPYMLYNDLLRLELHCKGENPRKYGFDPDEDMF